MDDWRRRGTDGALRAAEETGRQLDALAAGGAMHLSDADVYEIAEPRERGRQSMCGLFTAAKITHLGLLPQGQPERSSRVIDMVTAHDEAGFGGCTNAGECTAGCPKGIPLTTIGRLNRDFLKATAKRPDRS